MKRLGQTVVKNAIANVVRGGATAVVALALPHFLTHTLDRDHFAAWVLMLQIAAYASYLDFGLQTAVARYLAQAIERRDDVLRDQLISTAFAMLCAAGALALAVIGIVVWQLPHLFHGAPPALLGQLRGGVTVLAIAAAVQLPLSTFTGVLIGLHRNEYPALAIGGSRILGALAVILTARHTHSLIALAFSLSIFTLLGGVSQYIISQQLLPRQRLRFGDLSQRLALELLRYCSALSLWALGMLLVSGLDVTIVGYVHFADAGYYALAATLITFFTGLNGAVSSAFIAPMAVMQARGEFSAIRSLILKATRIATLGNLLLTCAALLFGAGLLRAWIGTTYARQVLPILEVLLLGQTVRLIGSAYSTALIATGRQKAALLAVLVEAPSNVLFSILGMVWLGPIGVAWGTLLAATLAVTAFATYTIPHSGIPLPSPEFIREGVARPLFCMVPLLAAIFLRGTRFSGPPIVQFTLVACGFLGTGALIWRKGELR